MPRTMTFAGFSFVGHWQKITLLLLLMVSVCWFFADTEVIALEPWIELGRMGQGFIHPNFFATEYLFEALWQTISFALLGITLGLLLGFPLALCYQHPLIAAICAFIRAIHEIFWALIFLQIFGLSAITGILAIALPYAATFARIFSDILQQAPRHTLFSLPKGTDKLSAFIYGRWMHMYPQIVDYIRYRFECALRSSAVLGFIGMPTLGFYLESAFRQGHYEQGGALLILFVLLIGSIRFWAKPIFLWLYLPLAIYFLPPIPAIDGQIIWRFLSVDILPPMLQGQPFLSWFDIDILSKVFDWAYKLITQQVFPGMIATLVLAFCALGLTYLLTLILLPFNTRLMMPKVIILIMRAVNLILRSLPEYLLAFVLMMLLGPSMLPAIIALALHNSGLMVFLMARQADSVTVPLTYQPRIDQYSYLVIPNLYPHFMGLLFYRFEVIIRETAILGMIGVMTLGFYVDSNFSEIRFSGALLLLVFTAGLNVIVDYLARRLLH
ncbi:ABC transporter permease [Psychromonas sp. MB-3u-54]|uniref:PhnE/PtxC family ABC transporter permease n=1 Tax=Psychromonas sp. MB-3u-54 TaxID=2058319 RepID=UPI000C32CB8D|nr:ABC transporter permease subunit [Psychromonas sp. MB-3u-54]PKH04462.1 ABC transporter permease [Psychromonas sp. MB-3u-54]